MRTKEIIGKKIIDAAGSELGEVEDIELDWENKKITSIVLGGKGELAGKIFGKLGARGQPDIPIPVEDIAVLGAVIILSKKMT